MIELIFVACLGAEPASCRDQSLLFTEDIGLMGCMVGAQTQLARWAETHPRQRVAGWRCRVADTTGKAI